VARLGDRQVARLLADPGIVRHRGKIESTINNARRAKDLRKEAGSLAAYIWSFEPAPADRPKSITRKTLTAMPASSASAALSKDLRKRGWSFVGPTTTYAFMQAMGLVNDHLEGCFCRSEVERARKALKRPGPRG
jgi:DNA-3-methyladenine glycosylase I